MTNCCESLNNYPVLKDVCAFMVGNDIKRCDNLDIRHPMIDWSKQYPATLHVEPDGRVDTFELLTALVGGSSLSYYHEICDKEHIFLQFLREHDLLPPWFIFDKNVINSVYKMKMKSDTALELANQLARYLSDLVEPRDHNEPTARPDELLKRGYGNCIEMANAFYGLCVVANIDCGFVVRYSSERKNFHILVFVQKKSRRDEKNRQYYDFASATDYGIEANRKSLVEITPVEAMLYFESEEAMTCVTCGEESNIKRLEDISTWLPNDFHIAYSLAMYLININSNKAIEWLKKTLNLNPLFIPAKQELERLNRSN